ncbi:MAG: hypothetical protein LBB50_01735 [Oscillospiraceae bacterium]|nr:hypothetical protein [Oscillospiraceae bacterium]
MYSDINGNLTLNPNNYGDKQIACGPFFNGYAKVMIMGVDGKRYTTVIDKTGKEQFEPVFFASNSFFISEGYFTTTTVRDIPDTVDVIDVKTGKSVKSFISPNGNSIYGGDVVEGFFRVYDNTAGKVYYVSVSGDLVIGA